MQDPKRETQGGAVSDSTAATERVTNKGSNWGVWVLLFVAACVGTCELLMRTAPGWTKGRPLRGRRRLQRRITSRALETQEEQAADAWRAIAADEYESVATFGELALDLMSVGAPNHLVTRCHEAALEEVRHAQMCMAVAQRLDGRTDPLIAPPQLRRSRRRPRWRTALLVRIAVESYIDGCVGEASSAWALAKLTSETSDNEVRSVLTTLAREEAGHARLGHAIVQWCREQGSRTVALSLEVARRRLAAAGAPNVDPVRIHSLRAFGVPDDALRAEALVWARATAARRDVLRHPRYPESDSFCASWFAQAEASTDDNQSRSCS